MFEIVLKTAMELYNVAGIRSPEWYAEQMMDIHNLPMHCPEHHFIVPAALLLAAHRRAGTEHEKVQQDLHTAYMLGQTIPGGSCGNCGCCGAAVGTGIFLAIWCGTNPKSTKHWALVQRITARSLEKIAVVEGPRCCKRVTFFALEAARLFCMEELGLELGEQPRVVCRYFSRNRECRQIACPYFPRSADGENI
jgi:hypothetical protein